MKRSSKHNINHTKEYIISSLIYTIYVGLKWERKTRWIIEEACGLKYYIFNLHRGNIFLLIILGFDPDKFSWHVKYCRLRRISKFKTLIGGCTSGVMVKAMNCGIVVSEFVLQSRYYVHFRTNTLWKGMNPLIL